MRMNEEQQEANNIPLKNKENKKNTTCYENLLNQSMRRSLWVANTKTKTLFVFFLFSFVSRGFLDRRKQNKDIFSVPSLFPFFSVSTPKSATNRPRSPSPTLYPSCLHPGSWHASRATPGAARAVALWSRPRLGTPCHRTRRTTGGRNAKMPPTWWTRGVFRTRTC